MRERWFGATGRLVPEIAVEGELDLGDALVLVSAALRAPMRAEGSIPRAAVSAVIACLVVFALQGALAALPAFRRGLRPQPAPSEVPLP